MSTRNRGWLPYIASTLALGLVALAVVLRPGCSEHEAETGTCAVGTGGAGSHRAAERPAVPSLAGLPQSPTKPSSCSGRVLARILVVDSSATPLQDVAAQVLDLDDGRDPRVLAGPLRTTAEGMALFDLGDEAPDGAHVEVAAVWSGGFRRTLVPLDASSALAGALQSITLPSGGSIQIDLSDLPIRARPAYAEISCFPAQSIHVDLGLYAPQEIPTSNVGSTSLQARLTQELLRLPMQDDGTTVPKEIPGGYVVTPVIAPTEQGWTMTSYSYTGRSVESPMGSPLFGIDRGRQDVLVTHWIRAPAAGLSVYDRNTRAPIPDAQLWLGIRPDEARAYLHGTGGRTDRNGNCELRVDLGPQLPSWDLQAATIIVIVQAPGYGTALLKTPFRWELVPSRVSLASMSARVRRIRGTLSFPDGQPAARIGLTVAPAFLANVTTEFKSGADGSFEIVIDDTRSAIFEESGALRFGLVTRIQAPGGNGLLDLGDKDDRYFGLPRPGTELRVDLRLHPVHSE